MAAVPARAGRPRPDRAGLRGPALGRRARCCASSSCSAPSVRDVPLLLLCTARPELVERDPSWAGAITGSLTITAAAAARRPAIATLYAHMFGQAAFSGRHAQPAGRAGRRQPALRPRVRPDADRAGRAAPVRTRLVAGAAARAADAGQRARGHRQPGRPARRRRPRGAAGRRGGRDAVLARRGRRRAGPAASRRSSGRCAGWSSATWSTSRPPRRWPGSRSTGSGTSWSATSATSGCRAPSGSPGTSGPPTGSTRVAAAATPTWPRCSPTTAAPPTRSPGRSAWTPRRYAAPARRRAAPGGPPGVRAARARRGGQPRRPGARAWPTTPADPVRAGCGWSCSAPRSPSTATATRSSPAAAPTSCADAGRPALRGRRPRPAPPGPGRCSGQAAWLRADRAGALSCLDRAVRAVRRRCRTPRRRPTRTPSWAGCTCSTTSATRRSAAAGTAAEIADRLGLVEAPTNARITIGIARYQAGDRPAWTSCTRSLEFCREPAAAGAAPGDAEPRLGAARGGRLDRAPTRCSRGRADPYRRRPDPGHRLLGGGACARTSRRLRPGCSPRPRRSWTPRPAVGHAGARRPALLDCGCCAASPWPDPDGTIEPTRRWTDRPAAAASTGCTGPMLGHGALCRALQGRDARGGGAASTSWPSPGARCRRWPAASGSPRPRTPPPWPAGTRRCAVRDMLDRRGAPHALGRRRRCGP